MNYKDRSNNMLGSMPYGSFIVYICSIVPYSSRRFGGKLQPKGWVEGEYTPFYTLYTQRMSPYGFDESWDIHLPRLVQQESR